MSNSPLVQFTRISPNKTVPRNHKIDTITIHCVVGQLTVGSIGNIFASPATQSSSNYGIGTDGKVGMYVEEKDRAWTSSNRSNDNRAVTIECASDRTHPYAVNAKVYATLIKLCADICKRNGIPELKWKWSKSLIGQVNQQNMTVHRWFSNTACPGDYLYNRMGEIAKAVNRQLKGTSDISSKPDKGAEKLYKIQVGAYRELSNANKMLKAVRAAGFEAFLVGELVEKDSIDIPSKTTDEIAQEVISGKWGNGDARVKALTEAGYDYKAVRDRVNAILK